MSKLKIETGSSPAGERFSITVTEKGPYLVYGRPPLAEQFITEANEIIAKSLTEAAAE